MKKTILIIAAVILTATTGLFAQKNSFKTAPLDLLGGRLGATYERSIKENLSILVSYKTINSSSSGVNAGDVIFPVLSALGGRTTSRTSGYLVETSIRRYADGKNGMSGFYIQPSFTIGEKVTLTQHHNGFLNIFEKEDPPTRNVKDLNAMGLRFGYQWVTEKGFTLDLGAGGNKYFNPTTEGKGAALFNCKLGYAF